MENPTRTPTGETRRAKKWAVDPVDLARAGAITDPIGKSPGTPNSCFPARPSAALPPFDHGEFNAQLGWSHMASCRRDAWLLGANHVLGS